MGGQEKGGGPAHLEGDELFFRQIEDPDSPFFSLKLSYRGDELVYAALDGKELAL